MTEIERAAELVRQGRLVAFPTETVYGLGADATNPRAIERIYQTKGRPSTNPLIVHVASAEVARRYAAEWPLAASRLAERFWPGPLTIVLPRNPAIPDNATAGLRTVGLRVPNHPVALELLRAFDGPVAAPSANRSTRVSPTTARHVREEFPQSEAAGGAAGNEPAMILDGGPCEVGIESTVLDLSGEGARILRPGRVTAAELELIVGPVGMGPVSVKIDAPAVSPGQQDVHYAPRALAYRFLRRDRALVARTIASSPPSAGGLFIEDEYLRQHYPEDHVLRAQRRVISMPADPAAYGQLLYGVLRELDARNAQTIWVEMPADTPEWAAVRDRLIRATRPALIM